MDLSNCEGKYIVVDGYRFTRDDKTGYYRCNKLRKRLHQYIWEKRNGAVKDGYHIHHKDHNKSNNDISNLIAIPSNKHISEHEQERLKEEGFLNKRKEIMNNKARPKAVEWHKSEEGRKWHSKHAKELAEKRENKVFTCERCGEEFEAWNTSRNKFCSGKCKSAWRREQGLDDEKRKCEYCGQSFEVNKYSKKRFCTKTCSNKAIPRLPQHK